MVNKSNVHRSIQATKGKALMNKFSFVLIFITQLFIHINGQAQTINSFSPDTAITGTTVSISGVFLGSVDSVSFGNVSAQSFVKVSDSLIQAVVGTGGTGSINLNTSNGSTTAPGFVYIDTSPAQELTNGLEPVTNCSGRGLGPNIPNYCLCDNYRVGKNCGTVLIFDHGLFSTTSKLEFSGPPTLYGGPILADSNNIYEIILEIENQFYDQSKSQGMTFGLGSTNTSNTTHDIGDYAFEYSYNAEGEMKTGGVVVGNGIKLKRDYKIKLVFDINAKTLNFYLSTDTANTAYVKQGTGFTNVVAAPGEQLKFYYSVLCFGTCIATFLPTLNPNLQYSPTPAEIAVFGDTLFGQIAPNAGQEVLSFAIKNLGGNDLFLNSVPTISISGADASEFSINKQPDTSIVSEEYTTFDVAFDPTTNGNKQAIVHVVSNDVDQGNFQFNVSGTAQSVGPTAVVSTVSNVSCNGQSNGDATASATAGTTPYTYLWSNSATTAIAGNLSAGTYSVTITDAQGTTDSASVTITEPTLLVSTAIVDSNTTCNGLANGGATASAVGGTASYTYSWSNSATTASITGVTAGTYSVTVSDANGCTDSTSMTITEPELITVSFGNSTNKLIVGANNNGAIFNVNLDGSNPQRTGPSSYNSFYDGVYDPVTNKVYMLWYYGVYSMDADGANFTQIYSAPSDGLGTGIDIDSDNGLVYFIDVQQDKIYKMNLDGSNLQTVYSGLIYGSGLALDLDNNHIYYGESLYSASKGVYRIDLTGTNDTTIVSGIDIETMKLNKKNGFLYYSSNDEVFTYNTNLGNNPVSILNFEVKGFAFDTINDVMFTSVFNLNKVYSSNMDGTNLTTIVSSSDITFNGANMAAPYGPVMVKSFTQPETLLACNGASDGELQTTVTKGQKPYNYLWSNGDITSQIDSLTANTYSITVTDNSGCSVSNSIIISQPPLLVSTAIVDSNITCNGLSDGGATTSATGGTMPYTYSWSNTATTATITGLMAGTYSVTITDANGCTSTSSATVTEPTILVSASVVDSNITCNGLSDGGATASSTGGTMPYTYAWSNSATTASITGVVAGTYSVTVSDANGCADSSSVTITEPSEFIISPKLVSGTTISQLTENDSLISFSGGTQSFLATESGPLTAVSIKAKFSEDYNITHLTAVIYEQGSTTPLASQNFGLTRNWQEKNIYFTNPTLVALGTNYTLKIQINTSAVIYWAKSTNNPYPNGQGATSAEDYYFQVFTGTLHDTLNLSCNGDADAQTLVSTTNGIIPFQYLWSNSDTNSNLSNLSAGTYTLTVTDNTGCTSTNSVTVLEPTVLVSATVVDSNITCNGLSDGGASASATGGTAPYTYAWSNSATTASITGVIAGTYSVTISDANGCTSTSSVTVTEPIILVSASIVDSNITCNGLSNGGATASSTGGTTPYTYSWSNTATTASITGVIAGTYSVTIMDANGCTSTSSVTVTEPTVLVATSVVDSNTTCNGLSDGGATASSTGGTTPYTYAWNNSATTASITGVIAGTYSVTITDAHGCTSTNSATVTEPTILISASVVDSNITCNGLSNGGATASSTGGTMPYTYAWSNAATTASITGVMAGTYSVTTTDANGCTSTSSVTVVEPTILVSTSVVDSNITCNGLSDGGASASATGGTAPYTYAWSNSATTASISGVMAGTYSVTITDANGCTTASSATVTEPTILVSASTVDSNITCNGLSDGGATASSTGGTMPYTYAWSNTATTASITGVIAGTYSVTITDANGCTDSSSVSISEPATLMAANVVDSNISCNGFADGGASASATGGTAPYTYAWSNSATTASITGVIAGSYSVTVSDANGCTSTSSATVTEPTILVSASVVDSNITCNGLSDGGATASSTGGTMPYTYAWSNAATTASITGVMAGTYSVTTTDANGCTSTSSVTVVEPTILVSTSVVDSNITCNGLSDGGATASSTGGTMPYTYAWSNSATTVSINGVIAGTYSVTITDANGCTDSASTMISEPTILVSASVVDSNITCNGLSDGGASASATGGTMPYTYAWSNTATTASITGVMAGTYSVTITDANGCTSTSSVTVVEPTILVSASVVDSNITCNGLSNGGATASVIGGTAPYSYAWNNAVSTASITGVTAGTYSVTIMDVNGCTDSSSIVISEPAILVSASTVDSNITCNGLSDGGATASATGGTGICTYSWSNSATTASITGVMAGTYSVTITDANGCTSTSSVTVVEPTILVSTSVVDSNITCNSLSDGGASASATGGTGAYTYAWSNAATTASITGIMAATYSVTISDANGCSSTSSSVVTEPAILMASTVVDSNVVCFGEANGGITASAAGGTMPYAYAWSNSATTASITGLMKDTFSVLITDVNGCMDLSSAIVTEPVLVTSNIGNDTTVCLNQAVVIDAGAGFATYSWSDNTSVQTTNANTSVNGSTDYSVTVTNMNGCAASDTMTVNVNNLSTVSIDPIDDLCAYGMDTLVATSGFNAYLWSTSDVTNELIVDASVLSQGSYTYSVIATDSNGCLAYDTTAVGVYNEVTIDLGPDVSIIWVDGVNDSHTVDAGTGYSSYLWSDSTTSTQDYVVTLLNMGVVGVEVGDANGCLGSDEIIVDFILGLPNVEIGTVKMYPNPAYDVLNIETSNFTVQSELEVKITSISGAMVFNQTYQTNGGDFKQAIDITNLPTGTYFVEFMSNGQTTTESFIVR
jgi:hypothetical protein